MNPFSNGHGGKEFDLSGLNAPQRQAASTINGPLLILAGAGSGKTRTITYRYAHMVKNLGLAPEQILMVTFTNKAAGEMKERVLQLTGREEFGRKSNAHICTFHSLGTQILREDISNLGYAPVFSIYDNSDSMALIRESLKSYNSDKSFDRKAILAKIGHLKNHSIGPDQFSSSRFFDFEDPYDLAIEHVYHEYQEKLFFYNAIDFNDILSLTNKLLTKHPELAAKYSQRFQYIMVDEYQDTNPTQFALLRALTSTHKNLCVVGDDDQSIYAFRGADIQNILDFEKHYPGATVIKLEENYRSTTSILNLANAIIKQNTLRKDKTLWTQKKSSRLPLLWACSDTNHEANIVASEIHSLKTQGHNLDQVAIIYRGNHQAPPFEDALRLNMLPYKIIGGQKLYEKKEVKDLIAYLGVIQNRRDELGLRRILNVPPRGIGSTTLKKFIDRSNQLKKPLFEVMQSEPGLAPNRANHILSFVHLLQNLKNIFREKDLASAIEQMVKWLKLEEYIDHSYPNPKEAARRKNDLKQFIYSAKRFEEVFHQMNKSNPSRRKSTPLRAFIEKILLTDSQDNSSKNKDQLPEQAQTGTVTLMTLHSSKGLEFDTCFLVGVEEGILPHKRSILDEKAEGGVEEERRLCYVGVTRARQKLIMTYCKKRDQYGKSTPRFPSRFLKNIDNKDEKLYQNADTVHFGHLEEGESEKLKDKVFTNLIDLLEGDRNTL